MANNLSLIEELDIEESIREPFSSYVIPDLRKKKIVSYSVFEFLMISKKCIFTLGIC